MLGRGWNDSISSPARDLTLNLQILINLVKNIVFYAIQVQCYVFWNASITGVSYNC